MPSISRQTCMFGRDPSNEVLRLLSTESGA